MLPSCSKRLFFTGQRATEQPKKLARWSSRNFIFPAGKNLELPDLWDLDRPLTGGILRLCVQIDQLCNWLLRSGRVSLPPRQHLEEQRLLGNWTWTAEEGWWTWQKKGEESEEQDGNTEQRASERGRLRTLWKNRFLSSAHTYHW